MAKQEQEEARAGKKRRGLPAVVVESEDDSEESDDDIMGDEFEGLSEEVESEEEEEEEESDEKEIGGERSLMGRIMQSGSGRALLRDEDGVSSDEEESMEGSRSRSEEDLRDIGSARRLDDDDDTGDSAWKEAEVVVEAGVSGDPGPSSSSAPDEVDDKEKRVEVASGSGGDGVVARGLDGGEEGVEGEDVMVTDDEDDEGDEDDDEEDAGSVGAESQSEGAASPSVSVSLEGGSDSDGGSGKGDSSKSSAYSRAFSKILQSKAAKESDTVCKTS